MELLIISLGAIILAAVGLFASEFGADSRELVDDSRHISHTAGLS